MMFLLINNGIISEKGYTSLKRACEELGVGYSSALYGKRKWIDADVIKEIREIEIVKQKRK